MFLKLCFSVTVPLDSPSTSAFLKGTSLGFYCRAAQTPFTRPLYVIRWRLIFADPRYGPSYVTFRILDNMWILVQLHYFMLCHLNRLT